MSFDRLDRIIDGLISEVRVYDSDAGYFDSIHHWSNACCKKLSAEARDDWKTTIAVRHDIYRTPSDVDIKNYIPNSLPLPPDAHYFFKKYVSHTSIGKRITFLNCQVGQARRTRLLGGDNSARPISFCGSAKSQDLRNIML